MTAPTKNFTVVGDTDIAANKPWTTTRATEFRDNDIHLEEWLGKDYTAAQNHNHDGVNSAPVVFSGLAGIDGLSGIEMVRKASTETILSTTTLQNDNELFASLAANEEVAFMAIIHHTHDNASQDIKFAFTVPTGATLRWQPPNGVYVNPTGAIGQTGDITASGTSLDVSGPTGNGQTSVFTGTVANGANSGNLQLQWAQVAAGAFNTRVLAGSRLLVWRE